MGDLAILSPQWHHQPGARRRTGQYCLSVCLSVGWSVGRFFNLYLSMPLFINLCAIN